MEPLTPPRVLRAIVYIRVSTEREEMQSPEQQLFSCEEYAKRNGIKIVGQPVEDLDLTGRSFAKRQVAAVIERIRDGEADVVLVWKWSRFGRNNYESQVNLRELEKAGGRLVAVTEDFDTTTYHGRFSRDNMLLVADLQSGIIGATWSEAHERRHRNGLPHTGQARFGYMRCPDCRRKEDSPQEFLSCATCKGVLVVDPVRGPALAEAYGRFADGESVAGIAVDMAERGVRSLQGRIMKATQWQVVMDSGFGAGLIRWRGPEYRAKHGRQSKKPSTYDNWARGAHERVIDADDDSLPTWERYKARREGSASIPWSTSAKYSCSGLLRCRALNKEGKVCDKKLVASAVLRSSGGDTKIFRCPDIAVKNCAGVTITLRRVEAEILDWLVQRSKGEDMGVMAMKRAARRSRAVADIPAVEREVSSLQAQKRRLLDLYLKELVSEEDFRNRQEELDAEAGHLESRLMVLRTEAGDGLIPSSEDFAKLANIWPKMAPARQRAALSKVVDRINIVKTEGKAYNRIEIVPVWEAERHALS
jgi:site-specific DNA recombinase